MTVLERVLLGSAAACAVAGSALATPMIDSAVIHTRVFNDAPASVVTTTNLYPTTISINDVIPPGGGFANRHNFRLSDNGGVSDAVFLNGDAFSFSSDVTLVGGRSEGGIQLSPWYSQQVDGVFMINAVSGEVAVFGGRLPFYSFTGNHGRTYTPGTTIRQSMIYNPNGLSMASPATIEYVYTDSSGTYSSGALAFDEGNPAEDPPYGLWGMLNDARVGGYFQTQVAGGGGTAIFGGMTFIPEPASLALLGLGLLTFVRRR